MLSKLYANESEDHTGNNKSLIINRININFNGKKCKLLSFTDITVYRRLKKQEEMSRLLKTLNTSVHHEMLCPLETNVIIAEKLVNSI